MNEGAQLRLSPTRNGHFAVACLCGAVGPGKDSEEKAIKAWNTRVYSGRDCPQSPFSFSPTIAPVSFKGNIESICLSTILQILSSENKTGVLHFRQGKATRAICFRDGKIVAASGRDGKRLGQIGYGKGLVSQKQLQKALKNAKGAGKRVGEMLLDLNYISEQSLKELVRYQVREALFDISLWAEGNFDYRDCAVEFDKRVVDEIDIMGMILEVTVRKDEWAAA
jgi:hypothetical protein